MPDPTDIDEFRRKKPEARRNLPAELRDMGTSSTVPDMERMDELLIAAADEMEQNRAALKVARDAILQFDHAQQSGPSWFTRGESAMYQHVHLWLRRGLKATQDALGPYDGNGEYLKEKSSP